MVGVDGSAGARAALEYALEEAERRHALLRVVCAVAVPEYWAASYGTYVPPPPADIVAEAQTASQNWVAEVVAERGMTGLPISVEAREGRPGEVLVQAAEGADLLVVGHRGRGSVTSVLLGSVGLYCVLHASCPVTVVRVAARAASDAAPAEAAVAPA